MTDNRDMIFNSMSRYLEQGRGNDWGSNKVWVNDPQNTVAIPHEGKKNYILYIERDAETRDRWEKIYLTQKVRNDERIKKVANEALRKETPTEKMRRRDKEWYAEKDRVKAAWVEGNKSFFRRKEKARQKSESNRATRLLDDTVMMWKYCTTPSETRTKNLDGVKFQLKIRHEDARSLIRQHNRPHHNMLQALLDLYYDYGYIRSGVVVDGEVTRKHYKLSEQ